MSIVAGVWLSLLNQGDLKPRDCGHQRICIGIKTVRSKETTMYAVIRTYLGTGAKQLFELLEERSVDIEATLRTVPGLVSYTLLNTGDGGTSITVCMDKAGSDASLKVAREWIQKNTSHIHANPPIVTEGPVIVQIN
ncbi:hypothetical protein D3C85_936910 [compost metagenome]